MAAAICGRAGAHGIVAHLRSDRRHMQDRDIEVLQRTVSTHLNVEMAASAEMVRVARRERLPARLSKRKDAVARVWVKRGGGKITINGKDQMQYFAREILRIRANINEIMGRHTGQPIETIERDMDRDRFMSAEEAKAYGLVDAVKTKRGELPN